MRTKAALAAAGIAVALTASAAAAATTGVSIQNFAFKPASVTVSQGSAVKWTNLDGAAHTTTSKLSGSLGWNSGGLGHNGTFSKTLPAAGTYSYVCTFHFGMAGTVKVPLLVDRTSGTTATTFTFTLASAAAPSGYSYVLQVKNPGTSKYVTYKTTTARTATFKAAKPGTYSFVSFPKPNSGTAAKPSPAKVIKVS